MKLILNRIIALVLSFIFTAQVALGSVSESNFWAERRKTFEKNQPNNNAIQLASLPASAPTPQSILKQLPSVGAALPSTTKWSDGNKNTAKNISKSLQDILDSIPLTYGSIQEVYDSGDNKTSPVVLIQDVHLNPEAQCNIAAVLQELIDQKQVGLVGVEAAFSNFNFTRFRSFPDKKITKQIAEAFLTKNLLAAPSFVGITSDGNPPPFVGIDDLEHYKANVRAYLSTVASKPKVVEKLGAIEKEIHASKLKIFSPELRAFDEIRNAYHKGDLGFGAYVKKLAGYDIDKDFIIDQFLAAYDLESTLDFKRVDEERRMVIESLTTMLKPAELSDLVAQSLAYRMGRMSFGAFYQNLKNLCESKGVSLASRPAFDGYIRYVLLSDGIKGDQLFSSISKLESNVLVHLAKTPEEKRLAALSEQVMLTQKLLDFSLTPKEWEKYRANTRSTDLPITADLKPFESFYSEADIRSQKMLNNVLAHSTSTSKALIMGGFHSPDIAALLKNQKISYAIVSPKITKINDSAGSSYLSVFTREKASLDQLFKGEKLFLGPAMLAAGTGIIATGKTNPMDVANNSEAMLIIEQAVSALAQTGDDGDPRIETEVRGQRGHVSGDVNGTKDVLAPFGEGIELQRPQQKLVKIFTGLLAKLFHVVFDARVAIGKLGALRNGSYANPKSRKIIPVPITRPTWVVRLAFLEEIVFSWEAFKYLPQFIESFGANHSFAIALTWVITNIVFALRHPHAFGWFDGKTISTTDQDLSYWQGIRKNFGTFFTMGLLFRIIYLLPLWPAVSHWWLATHPLEVVIVIHGLWNNFFSKWFRTVVGTAGSASAIKKLSELDSALSDENISFLIRALQAKDLNGIFSAINEMESSQYPVIEEIFISSLNKGEAVVLEGLKTINSERARFYWALFNDIQSISPTNNSNKFIDEALIHPSSQVRTLALNAILRMPDAQQRLTELVRNYSGHHEDVKKGTQEFLLHISQTHSPKDNPVQSGAGHDDYEAYAQLLEQDRIEDALRMPTAYDLAKFTASHKSAKVRSNNLAVLARLHPEQFIEKHLASVGGNIDSFEREMLNLPVDPYITIRQLMGIYNKSINWEPSEHPVRNSPEEMFGSESQEGLIDAIFSELEEDERLGRESAIQSITQFHHERSANVLRLLYAMLRKAQSDNPPLYVQMMSSMNWEPCVLILKTRSLSGEDRVLFEGFSMDIDDVLPDALSNLDTNQYRELYTYLINAPQLGLQVDLNVFWFLSTLEDLIQDSSIISFSDDDAQIATYEEVLSLDINSLTEDDPKRYVIEDARRHFDSVFELGHSDSFDREMLYAYILWSIPSIIQSSDLSETELKHVLSEIMNLYTYQIFPEDWKQTVFSSVQGAIEKLPKSVDHTKLELMVLPLARGNWSLQERFIKNINRPLTKGEWEDVIKGSGIDFVFYLFDEREDLLKSCYPTSIHEIEKLKNYLQEFSSERYQTIKKDLFSNIEAYTNKFLSKASLLEIVEELGKINVYLNVVHQDLPHVLHGLVQINKNIDSVKSMFDLLKQSSGSVFVRILRMLGEGRRIVGGHNELVQKLIKSGHWTDLYALILDFIRQDPHKASAQVEGVLILLEAVFGQGEQIKNSPMDESQFRWESFAKDIQEFFVYDFETITPGLFKFFLKNKTKPNKDEIFLQLKTDIDAEFAGKQWGGYFGVSDEFLARYEFSETDELSFLARYLPLNNHSLSDLLRKFSQIKAALKSRGRQWVEEVDQQLRRLLFQREMEIHLFVYKPLSGKDFDRAQLHSNLGATVPRGKQREIDTATELKEVIGKFILAPEEDEHKDQLKKLLMAHVFQELAGQENYFGSVPNLENDAQVFRWVTQWHTILVDSFGQGQLGAITKIVAEEFMKLPEESRVRMETPFKQQMKFRDLNDPNPKLGRATGEIILAIANRDNDELTRIFSRNFLSNIQRDDLADQSRFNQWLEKCLPAFIVALGNQANVKTDQNRTLTNRFNAISKDDLSSLLIQAFQIGRDQKLKELGDMNFETRAAIQQRVKLVMGLFKDDLDGLKKELDNFNKVPTGIKQSYTLGFYDDLLHLMGFCISNVCTWTTRERRILEKDQHFGKLALKDSSGRIFALSQVQLLRQGIKGVAPKRSSKGWQVMALPGINFDASDIRLDREDGVLAILEAAQRYAEEAGMQGVVIPENGGIYSNQSQVHAVITRLESRGVLVQGQLTSSVSLANYNYQKVLIVNIPTGLKTMKKVPKSKLGASNSQDENQEDKNEQVQGFGVHELSMGELSFNTRTTSTDLAQVVQERISALLEPMPDIGNFILNALSTEWTFRIRLEPTLPTSSINRSDHTTEVTLGKDVLYDETKLDDTLLADLLAEMVASSILPNYSLIKKQAAVNENAYFQLENIKALLNYRRYLRQAYWVIHRYNWDKLHFLDEMPVSRIEEILKNLKQDLDRFTDSPDGRDRDGIVGWNVFLNVMQDGDPQFLVTNYIHLLTRKNLMTDKNASSLIRQLAKMEFRTDVSIAYLRNMYRNIFAAGNYVYLPSETEIIRSNQKPTRFRNFESSIYYQLMSKVLEPRDQSEFYSALKMLVHVTISPASTDDIAIDTLLRTGRLPDNYEQTSSVPQLVQNILDQEMSKLFGDEEQGSIKFNEPKEVKIKKLRIFMKQMLVHRIGKQAFDAVERQLLGDRGFDPIPDISQPSDARDIDNRDQLQSLRLTPEESPYFELSLDGSDESKSRPEKLMKLFPIIPSSEGINLDSEESSPMSLIRNILLRQAISRAMAIEKASGEKLNKAAFASAYLAKPWVKVVTVLGGAMEAVVFGSLGYVTALSLDSNFGLAMAAVRILLVVGFFVIDYFVAPPVNGIRGSPKMHILMASLYALLPFASLLSDLILSSMPVPLVPALMALAGFLHVVFDTRVAVGKLATSEKRGNERTETIALWSAPFKELPYQLPSLVALIGGPVAWVVAGVLAVVSSLRFAQDHWDRSRQKKLVLFGIGLFLNFLIVAPTLLFFDSHTTSVFTKIFYGFGTILIGHYMAIALIQFVKRGAEASPYLAGLRTFSNQWLSVPAIEFSDLTNLQPGEVGVSGPWFNENPHQFFGRGVAIAQSINNMIDVAPNKVTTLTVTKGEGDNQVTFTLRKVEKQRIWSFPEEKSEAVAKLAGLRHNPDIAQKLDELNLLDVVAQLGSDSLSLYRYLSVCHPDLTPHQLTQLVSGVVSGVRQSDNLKIDYEGFSESLAPLLNVDVVGLVANNSLYRTNLHSFRITGRSPPGATYIVVTGPFGRRVRVKPDGTFDVSLPLVKTGDVNEFVLFAVNSEQETRSPDYPLTILQTDEPRDPLEILRDLLSQRDDLIAAAQTSPFRRNFFQETLEVSFLIHFTEDPQEGFAFLQRKITEASGKPAYQNVLRDVETKFKEIGKIQVPFVATPGQEPPTLYFYQKWVLYYLQLEISAVKRKGLVLSLEQGLGKTIIVQALRILLKVASTVIAPNALVSTWLEEARKFFGAQADANALSGPYEDRDQALVNWLSSLLVTNQEFLRNLTEPRAEGLSKRHGLLAFDEADFAGSRNSLQAEGARMLGKRDYLFRLLLSGTPFERILQIPLLLQVFMDNPLEGSNEFLEAYNPRTREGRTGLRLLMVQNMLRLRKSDVFREVDPKHPLSEQLHRLPKKEFVSKGITSRILPEQMEQILQVFTDYPTWVQNHRERQGLSKDDQRLIRKGYLPLTHIYRQILNRPSYYGSKTPSPKYKLAETLVTRELDELRSQKVLLFCSYQGDVEELMKKFKSRGVRGYYGGLAQDSEGYAIDENKRRRTYVIDEREIPVESSEAHARPMLVLDVSRLQFLKDTEVHVMVGTYAAMSAGLTLPADAVIIFDQERIRNTMQAQDRSHRIGMNRSVVRYYDLEEEYDQEFLAQLEEKERELFGEHPLSYYSREKRLANQALFHAVIDGVGDPAELEELERTIVAKIPGFHTAGTKEEQETTATDEVEAENGNGASSEVATSLDSPQSPINLNNSGGALKVMLVPAFLLFFVATYVGRDSLAFSHLITMGFSLIIYFLILWTIVKYFVLKKLSPSNQQTGPPSILLLGRAAISNRKTDFVEYNSATNQFHLNPALYALLTHQNIFVRFSSRFMVAVFAGVHEWTHTRTRGKSEWMAYGVQALSVVAVSTAIFNFPILCLIGLPVGLGMMGIKHSFRHTVSQRTISSEIKDSGFSPDKPMNQTAQWLAQIGVALHHGEINNLLGPTGAIGVGSKIVPPDSDAQFLSNVALWGEQKEFQDMVKEALRTQLQQEASLQLEIDENEAQELAEVIIAVALAQTAPRRIQAQARDHHLLVLEGSDRPDDQVAFRLKTMTLILATGLNASTTLAANTAAMPEISRAIKALTSAGFDMRSLSKDLIDLQTLIGQDGTTLDPDKAVIAQASLVVAPQSRLGKNLSTDKFISLEHLIPLEQIMSLSHLIQSIRSALVAA